MIDYFLEEYLHPRTRDPKSKISLFVDDLTHIDNGGLYFPIFVQELHFVGQKVFTRRRNDLLIADVAGLCSFLKRMVERKVGEDLPMEYEGNYCRFGIVIVGKAKKVQDSIEPYVKYIQRELATGAAPAESIYLLAPAQNRVAVQRIAARFPDYDVMRRVKLRQKIRLPDDEREIQAVLLVLRRRGVELIQPSVRGAKIGTPREISLDRE